MREGEVETEAPVMRNKLQEDEQGKEYADDDIDDKNSNRYSLIASRRGTTVGIFGVKRIRCVVMALLAE